MTDPFATTAGNPSASFLLGRKLDSIPFSLYHLQLILVLGAVGFVEGYDLALGGSLLVLAKEPLQLTAEQIRWLAVAPTLLIVVGAFIATALSDRISRKTVMQIGVVSSTALTLLIPLAQTGTQLVVIRVLTGLGIGFALSAFIILLSMTFGNTIITVEGAERILNTPVVAALPVVKPMPAE